MYRLSGKYMALTFVSLLFSVAVVFVYLKYDPTESHWFPQCPLRQLTGLSCPACGAQRATHSLLNGRFGEALSYNYFYIIGIPFAIVVCIAYILRKCKKANRIAEILEHRFLAMIYVYAFFAWFIIRNILSI